MQANDSIVTDVFTFDLPREVYSFFPDGGEIDEARLLLPRPEY